MKKSSGRVDAARNAIVPAATDLAQTATDKVGPLAAAAAAGIGAAADKVSPYAHSAAERIVPLAQSARDKAGPLAQSAVGKAGPLAHSAAEKIGPLAQSAAEKAGPLAHSAADYVTPYAQQARDLVSPYAHSAADYVTPYAQQARDLVSPYAHSAAGKISPLAASAVAMGSQVAHDAADRFGPALGEARDRVSDDLLPRLNEALGVAAASPVAVEAAKRGRATLAAARGELALPEPRKKSRWLRRVVIVTAAGGVAVAVARKFLGSKDADWQAARPSTPYAAPTSAAPSPWSTATDPTSPAEAVNADADEDQQAGMSAHDLTLVADGAPVPSQPAEGGEVEATAAPEQTDAVEAVDTPETGDTPETETKDTPETRDTVEVTAASPTEGASPTEVSEVDRADATEDEQDGMSAHDAAREADGQATPDQPVEGTDKAPADPSGATYGSTADVDLGAPESEQAGDSVQGVPVEDTGYDGAVMAPESTEEATGGSYVGNEPPEGFVIKGNERSMKYHMPDGGGYAQTIAEVWFDSEEAAQQAGYTRAQG